MLNGDHGMTRVNRSIFVTSLAALLAVASLSGQPRPARAVQVGLCTPLRNIEAAKAAGFDYLELGTSELTALADADFEKAAADIKALGLPVPATNLFLPATLKVTGPDVDREQQMAHVRKAFTRLSRLGTQIVVFGSGGARRVPDGYSKDDAFKQLVEFGRRAAAEARPRGITIAVEPLRREETNIINSAAEGLKLVEAINDPNFELMIDFYHLASEHEDPAIVLKANQHIRHLHMANPQGRVYPAEWGEFDYGPFFANLKKIGYDKRISIEGTAKDFPREAPKAIALLRRAFQN
jgi:sugar phosphate isomerase/epimerase